MLVFFNIILVWYQYHQGSWLVNSLCFRIVFWQLWLVLNWHLIFCYRSPSVSYFLWRVNKLIISPVSYFFCEGSINQWYLLFHIFGHSKVSIIPGPIASQAWCLFLLDSHPHHHQCLPHHYHHPHHHHHHYHQHQHQHQHHHHHHHHQGR